MTGPEFDPDYVEQYLQSLATRIYPESAKDTPDRHAALRMIRALLAIEAGYAPDATAQRKMVAQVHAVARRLAAHRLRLCYDGDRYYITIPPGSDRLCLWSQRVATGEATGMLPVLGTADNLADLATVVEQITTRLAATEAVDGSR